MSILKSFAAPAAGRYATTTRPCGTASTRRPPASWAWWECRPTRCRDREHILLSSLFNTAWSAGQDLDLPALIQQIMTPPFEKVGVVDLESFYPSKDRSDLAMLINNLLAAPDLPGLARG